MYRVASQIPNSFSPWDDLRMLGVMDRWEIGRPLVLNYFSLDSLVQIMAESLWSFANSTARLPESELDKHLLQIRAEERPSSVRSH